MTNEERIIEMQNEMVRLYNLQADLLRENRILRGKANPSHALVLLKTCEIDHLYPAVGEIKILNVSSNLETLEEQRTKIEDGLESFKKFLKIDRDESYVLHIIPITPNGLTVTIDIGIDMDINIDLDTGIDFFKNRYSPM